jgi:S1-C subfamily serine protease
LLVCKNFICYGKAVRFVVGALFIGLAAGRLAFAQVATLSGLAGNTASTASNPSPLSFTGSGPSETTSFTVQPRWQVRWMAQTPFSVTIEDATGNAVAGAGGQQGVLYLPSGGSFKIRLIPQFAGMTVMATSWRMFITQVGAPGGTVTATDYIAYAPPDMTLVRGQQSQSQPTIAGGTAIMPPPTVAASGVAIANVAPIGAPPPPSVPATPPAVAGKLTDAQTAAMVLITGDNAEGTGFLVKTVAGSFVVTNQHVVGNNPHLKITTTGGADVTVLGLQGAADRDLVMIPIRDNNYSYFEMASDVGSSVQVGDPVITPGNSQGGGVMLPTSGTVLGIGPQKVEISNPIYHGNSGGPIIQVKTGKVIGVVTEGLQVDTSNALDLASHQSANSAITGTMRYFGLRLDTVAKWEACTWQRFEIETTFLNQFHERSKCLDSYLNTGLNDTSEWGTYFARDDKVKEANQKYGEDMGGGVDGAQKMDAVRNLIFSLDSVADSDMDQITIPGNFYPFDQERAKEEADYRRSLKTEIANMSSDVNRIAGLARPVN